MPNLNLTHRDRSPRLLVLSPVDAVVVFLVALFGAMVGHHRHGTASSVAHELSSQLALQLLWMLLSKPAVIIYSLVMH